MNENFDEICLIENQTELDANYFLKRFPSRDECDE